MEKQTRIALDEFIEYKAQVDERVNQLAKAVEDKREKVATLEAEYAKSFISGNNVNEKELNKAKTDLSDSQSRLELVKEAKKTDEKLIKLADQVHTEFYESEKLIKSINTDKRQEIQELASLLDIKRRELKSEDSRLTLLFKEQSKERVEALPYMSLDTGDKNRFITSATDENYNSYRKRMGMLD